MVWFSSCRSLGCRLLGCGLLVLTKTNASVTATGRVIFTFVIDSILWHHPIHVVDYELILSADIALNIKGMSAQAK